MLAGDAAEGDAVSHANEVSIRARHCWRAMRRHCCQPQSQRCFNPRPPLLAGDAISDNELHRIDKVSIRARHCWRAMLHLHHISFTNTKFQSAPAIAGGRCSPKQGVRLWLNCFNPRPPLLAGDAIRREVDDANRIVSIRARHCWRAMPLVSPMREWFQAFQSAPAIAGGRCVSGWQA